MAFSARLKPSAEPGEEKWRDIYIFSKLWNNYGLVFQVGDLEI